MRILFVDNHVAFTNTVIAAFLVEHEIDIVATVTEAKQALARARYDLALVDHDLDDGAGVDFVRWARARGRDVPIIAVSARAEGNEALMEAGANAVCAKTKFAQVGRVIAEVSQRSAGRHPMARAAWAVVGSRARGTGDDRAQVMARDDGLVVLVVDGASGIGGASTAADAVVAAVSEHTQGGVSTLDLVPLLRSIDRRCAGAAGGQASAAIAVLTEGCVRGASVGDCGVWLFLGANAAIDLTDRQVRKPLLGSGAALPMPFSASLTGTLLLATDGLLDHASHQRIREVLLQPDLDAVPARLVDLVRLPSGAMPDDVAIVVCRR